MALDETLAHADRDVGSGDLGRARDRLEGLLTAYPDELPIRARLGDIYWRLQYPERAGRYWYLLPSERAEMDVAKDAFAARHGGDPGMILRAVGYHGGLESVRGTYAGEALRDLAQRAGLSEAALEAIVRRRQPGERPAPIAVPRGVKLAGWAIAVVSVGILVLAFIGARSLLGF